MRSKLEQYSDRPLRRDDAAYVVALHRAPHAAPFMHCPTEARVAELADDASVRARIIVKAGEPAGFMVMSDHDGWLEVTAANANARRLYESEGLVQ